MIKTEGIDHSLLHVSSTADAKQYFETVFGFSCSYRDKAKTIVVIESPQTHFFIKQFANQGVNFEQHISFKVESIDDVIQQLKKNNIDNYETGMTDCFHYQNYKWCEWKGPDGIRLECVEAINRPE